MTSSLTLSMVAAVILESSALQSELRFAWSTWCAVAIGQAQVRECAGQDGTGQVRLVQMVRDDYRDE